jgi:hypothetical protein
MGLGKVQPALDPFYPDIEPVKAPVHAGQGLLGIRGAQLEVAQIIDNPIELYLGAKLSFQHALNHGPQQLQTQLGQAGLLRPQAGKLQIKAVALQA